LFLIRHPPCYSSLVKVLSVIEEKRWFT